MCGNTPDFHTGSIKHKQLQDGSSMNKRWHINNMGELETVQMNTKKSWCTKVVGGCLGLLSSGMAGKQHQPIVFRFLIKHSVHVGGPVYSWRVFCSSEYIEKWWWNLTIIVMRNIVLCFLCPCSMSLGKLTRKVEMTLLYNNKLPREKQ